MKPDKNLPKTQEENKELNEKLTNYNLAIEENFFIKTKDAQNLKDIESWKRNNSFNF